MIHKNITEADGDPGALSQTASDGAVQFIRSLIHSGELGPGDRLPPARELSAQLGISRLTLHTALKALEALGYLTIRRGTQGGAFVSSLPELMSLWAEWMRNNVEEIDDVLDFRIAVETKASALAAQRRSAEDLAGIEAAIERPWGDTPSFLRADAEFHRAVARAAHNARLDKAIRMARRELFLPVHDERVRSVEEEHRAVFLAIREQDPISAAAAMEAHIRYTWMTLRTLAEELRTRRWL